ncbi:MAG: flagellar hook protein FlgE [Oscillospiraceae bacterium]|nr:flagellar hook protein FlgE [Oscillospiraceae bacterium]
MMRSMYSGVSGLRVHQTRMDVIGNNIANVNTVGFKSGRVVFSDVFSQLSRGASAPNLDTGRGGTNPMQIGLGANVYAIDNLMMRGSVQRTDNPTDIAIDGEGFFIVRGGMFDTYKFTRAGNFTLDAVGNLVTPSGMNVMGWQNYTYDPSTGRYTFDTEQPLEEINIYSDTHNGNKRIIAPSETTFAQLTGNLDADVEDGTTFKVPFVVYDEIGNRHDITIEFTAQPPTTSGSDRTREWTYEVLAGDTYDLVSGMTGTVEFGIGNNAGSSISNGVIVTPTGPQDLVILPTDPSIASQLTFQIDFSNMTQYASQSNVKASRVDGYTTGTFETFSIGSDGVISAVYSNGQMKPLAQIALAMFDNPGGLLKEGDNLFSQTTNSGAFTRGVMPTYGGSGQLAPGTLEMSNVDLSREFSDMIVTQRGFQANTRIITTSDEMLMELVNLKR